jgi:hypothetical protein
MSGYHARNRDMPVHIPTFAAVHPFVIDAQRACVGTRALVKMVNQLAGLRSNSLRDIAARFPRRAVLGDVPHAMSLHLVLGNDNHKARRSPIEEASTCHGNLQPKLFSAARQVIRISHMLWTSPGAALSLKC